MIGAYHNLRCFNDFKQLGSIRVFSSTPVLDSWSILFPVDLFNFNVFQQLQTWVLLVSKRVITLSVLPILHLKKCRLQMLLKLIFGSMWTRVAPLTDVIQLLEYKKKIAKANRKMLSYLISRIAAKKIAKEIDDGFTTLYQNVNISHKMLLTNKLSATQYERHRHGNHVLK